MGESEIEMVSPVEGAVISTLQLPLVNRGDAMFHLARLKGSEGDPGDLSLVEELDPDDAYPHLD